MQATSDSKNRLREKEGSAIKKQNNKEGSTSNGVKDGGSANELETISMSLIGSVENDKQVLKNMCPILILLISKENTEAGLKELFSYVWECIASSSENASSLNSCLEDEHFDVYICVGAMILVELSAKKTKLKKFPKIQTYGDCLIYFLYYRIVASRDKKMSHRIKHLKVRVFEILGDLTSNQIQEIVNLHDKKRSKFYDKYLEILSIISGSTAAKESNAKGNEEKNKVSGDESKESSKASGEKSKDSSKDKNKVDGADNKSMNNAKGKERTGGKLKDAEKSNDDDGGRRSMGKGVEDDRKNESKDNDRKSESKGTDKKTKDDDRKNESKSNDKKAKDDDRKAKDKRNSEERDRPSDGECKECKKGSLDEDSEWDALNVLIYQIERNKKPINNRHSDQKPAEK